jgi:hypothetical protein
MKRKAFEDFVHSPAGDFGEWNKLPMSVGRAIWEAAWDAAEAPLKALLSEARTHLLEHDADYHHRTPKELLAQIAKVLK